MIVNCPGHFVLPRLHLFQEFPWRFMSLFSDIYRDTRPKSGLWQISAALFHK